MIPIDRDPMHLAPPFRAAIVSHISKWNAANPAHPIQLFEGLRGPERQADMYAIGRTVDGQPCIHNGVIRPLGSCALHPRGYTVTNSPPWMSWHQYGFAGDLVFDADPIRPGPQWTWDGKQPWPQMCQAAARVGLESAFFWKKFPEAPHVQITFGLQLIEAKALFEQGGLAAVWKAAA